MCCGRYAVGCRLLAVGCWLLPAGCRLQVVGSLLLAVGQWPQAADCGCKLLAFGCWPLVPGCRLLTAVCRLLVAGCSCWLRLTVAGCCCLGCCCCRFCSTFPVKRHSAATLKQSAAAAASMFRFTLAVPPCSPYERMRSIVSLHTLAVEKHGAGHQLGTTDMWQFGVLCVGYMQDAGVPTDRKSWMAQALLSQSTSLGRVVCCRTNHKQQQNWNKRHRRRSIIHIAVNDDMWHLATELVHWLKVVHSAQELEPAIQQSMLRGQFEPMAHQWLTQNVLYACCQPEKLCNVSRLGLKYGDKWDAWMLAFLHFHCLTPGTFRGSSSMQEHVEQRQQQQQPPCVIDERVMESESSSASSSSRKSTLAQWETGVYADWAKG